MEFTYNAAQYDAVKSNLMVTDIIVFCNLPKVCVVKMAKVKKMTSKFV